MGKEERERKEKTGSEREKESYGNCQGKEKRK